MRFAGVIKYFAAFTIPGHAFIALYFQGIWVFLTPVYAFLFLSAIEMILPLNTKNKSALEEELSKKDPLYDLVLFLNVPVQYAIVIYFLFTVTNQQLLWWEILGMVISTGICCGVIGINVAHELGHRKSKTERILSKSLLLTSLYMHFIIEHNKGHHKRVSTDDDPSSARLNEPIYAFFFRTIIGSYVSAWHIQLKELKDNNHTFFSLQNEMGLFFLLQLGVLIFIFIIFSPITMLLFILACMLGILLLESVNYIEHYGLRRKLAASGNYERVQPWHSWNSDHVIGRLVLYELTRHSDHHFMASRKYQILRHLDDAPQLPAGYPAMIILSLFPPLFFRIMNPRVEKVFLSH